MVLSLNIYTAFIYIIVNSWFEAFPIVFEGTYNFNLIESGAVYISANLGAVLGASIYLYWVKFLRAKSGHWKVFKTSRCLAHFFSPSVFLFLLGDQVPRRIGLPPASVHLYFALVLSTFFSLFLTIWVAVSTATLRLCLPVTALCALGLRQSFRCLFPPCITTLQSKIFQLVLEDEFLLLYQCWWLLFHL